MTPAEGLHATEVLFERLMSYRDLLRAWGNDAALPDHQADRATAFAEAAQTRGVQLMRAAEALALRLGSVTTDTPHTDVGGRPGRGETMSNVGVVLAQIEKAREAFEELERAADLLLELRQDRASTPEVLAGATVAANDLRAAAASAVLAIEGLHE